MSQLLKQLLNERLAAAAEEIFGLVEKTIAEYQDEVFRSRTEVIALKRQIEQLSALKPEDNVLRADVQERRDACDPERVKEEQEELCISRDVEPDAYEDYQVPLGESDLTSQTVSAITLTIKDEDKRNESDHPGSSLCGPSYSKICFTKKKPAKKDQNTTCHLCHRSFRNNPGLRRHMEIHMREKIFKCTQCDKVFEERIQLDLHLEVHRGEKSFNCDVCGQKFSQNFKLIDHKREHKREKTYFCKKCGKSFFTSHHLRSCRGPQKQGEKQRKSFCCMTCGRAFYTESDLRLHMEIHKSWKRHLSEKRQENQTQGF